MQFKLSIITVNKNNAIGLEKTCLSIITQTFKDYEWIIIDGASEDNSVEIINKYSSHIFYWVSEPDSGIYNAMNKAIKLANGDFLLFLNSGDFLLYPWTLKTVISEIETLKEADVYYSDVIWDTFYIQKFPKNITLDFFIKENIGHQNSLIKRKLFDFKLYNENYHIVSDWHFFITMFMEQNIIFCHLKTNISIYDSLGLSSTNIKLSSFEKKDALTKLDISQKKKKKSVFFIIWKIILKIFKYILPYGIYKFLIYIKNKNN